MKTAELIRRLQAEDPSGELEVVVGCVDIYFLARQPMYYDGMPVLLVRDPEKDGRSYSIVGLHVPGSSGDKVRIHLAGADDVFLDRPETPVTYGDEYARRHREASLEEARAEARAVIASVGADPDAKWTAGGAPLPPPPNKENAT